VSAGNVQSLRVQSRTGAVRTKTVWAIWVAGMRRPRVLGARRPAPPGLEAD
jgi:hypothetical protein